MKQVMVLVAAVAMLAVAPVANAQGAVVVNGAALSSGDVQALEAWYGHIEPGAYWYDTVSGLWGHVGGPADGQILAGLDLGGPLRSDASDGHTGVFFNGRQLHDSEVAYLQRLFGQVPRGRYWLGPDGVGGPEGGAATFSVAAQGASQSQGTSKIDRGYGGTYGSDGSCYYISVEGGDVMGPGC